MYADIGLKLRQQQQGYNYRVPQTSYGVPSYQVGSNAGDYNSGYTESSGGGSNYVQGSGQGQNNGYQSGFASVGDHGNYHNGNGAAVGQYYQLSNGASQPSYQASGAAQGSYQSFNQYQTSNQYQSSDVHKYQEHYNQIQQQPAQIFKHFYIHAAPDEPEVPRPRQPITFPPPQKHYKIIFIKTPSQPAYPPQYIPIPPQNEEKTIVYVLVKKPEEPQDIVIPKVEPKPPTKPEVFFIKYNNKEDSQAVINDIVTDYNNKGDSVNFGGLVANGAAFGSGSHSHGGVGQFVQTGDSGYSQAGATGQYSQAAAGSFGQSSSQSANEGSFGSSNAGASQTLSVASTDSNNAGAGSSAGFTSTTSNFDASNLISTSQGVPHETYGTPQFRS